MLSLSVFPLPIRFLSSASLPVPATQPLFLPFHLFPASPHSGFPGARFRSRFLGFPVLSGPVSRALFPGSCTRLSVCFLSSLPVSLPQLFHRCFPYAFAFGPFPRFKLSFVRFSLGSDYSAFCFFLSASSRPRLTAAFPVPDSALASSASPYLRPDFSCLPSGFRTRLSVCFLSTFPDSLPQLFLRCLPYAFAFGLSPSDPLPFVRFSSGSGYSAFCFFLSFSSRFRLTVASPMPVSALASSVPSFFPA